MAETIMIKALLGVFELRVLQCLAGVGDIHQGPSYKEALVFLQVWRLLLLCPRHSARGQ